MVISVACHCGSSDNLIRGKVAKYHRELSLTIPITKGKSKSLAVLNTIPQVEETQNLRNHLEGVSKWAVLIGVSGDAVKWVDLANGQYIKNDVDAELLIKHFA